MFPADAMLSAAQAQTCTFGKQPSPDGKLEFPRKRLCGEPRAAAPAVGETVFQEVLLMLGFDTEKPRSPKKSKSRGGSSPNMEISGQGIH